MIFILIGIALPTRIAALSESLQAVRDPQIEQALTKARQVATELAEKVQSLLFQEIENDGFVSAVRGAISVKVLLPRL